MEKHKAVRPDLKDLDLKDNMADFDAPDTFSDDFSSIPKSWGTRDAYLIVFGNEKGGSGKSTTAMHVAIGLLKQGYNVGSIDLDARQGTFTRYLRNRFQYVSRERKILLAPYHMAIERSAAENVAEQQTQEREFLSMAIAELSTNTDFIIIDTPGTDSYLSRLAHSHADTLITPMNDSFVDLDLLADVDPDTLKIKGPSVYTKMVNDQRVQKALRNGGTLDWIVMRTRLSHINAKNKRDIAELLTDISHEYDFRVAPGFGERVIFRELFLKGLTLMDLEDDEDTPLTLSQITARQEVRSLISAIDPESLKPLAKESTL
ncbi:MAG: division plane positioning ATPase MipZ [Pseudomonadota bacterium]